MSLGFSAPLSSMKSPKLVSSLSPTGDCREIGCCAILRTARTRPPGHLLFFSIFSSAGAGPLDGHLHFGSDFFGGRFASKILDQLLLHTHQLVDRLDHVNRNANGAG